MDEKHPLRIWRNAQNWTQRELADKLGMVGSHVSQLENGKKGVSLAVAARIERLTNGAVPASALAPQQVRQ